MRKIYGHLKGLGFLNSLLLITYALTAILILTQGALVTFSVITRYFFQKPFGWIVEITEYILLWSTFIGAAWVLKEDGHVKIDLLIRYLPSELKWWVEFITCFLGGLLFISIFWFSSLEIFDIYIRGILYVKMLKLPKYILLIIIPIGCLLLSMQYLKLIKQKISEKKTKMLDII